MLRSGLCDFRDVYIVFEAKFTASFNPRTIDYGSNDFPDDVFPNRTFPPGSAAE